VIFSGTGCHGVYHAGVLRALHEAGVRVDVVAGHGVGAATAVLAAIDGGAKLGAEAGIWRSPGAHQFYRWRWPLRATALLSVVLAAVLALPLLAAAAFAAAYAIGFLVSLVGAVSGESLVGWASLQASRAFSGTGLPTLVPRLAMLVVLVMLVVLAIGPSTARPEASGMSRTVRGRWWWRLLSAPLDAGPLRAAVSRAVWDLVRGGATTIKPSRVVLSRRYTEVLVENLGQPGCRELLIGATDLDARRDVVGALLPPARHEKYFAAQPGRDRAAEVVNLAASDRDLLFDLLGAALTPSIGAEAHPIGYASDGYWRGETHRGCDRPGILARLLAELDTADVVQVIVVSAAAPPPGPHRLRVPPVEPRARLGEFLAAAEAAALDDGVAAARSQFDAVFVVQPAHNPINPFDMAGADDEASDRQRALGELEKQGYDDAYEQFIDPVVGASGEQLAPAMT
jgi:hypothetical protein